MSHILTYDSEQLYYQFTISEILSTIKVFTVTKTTDLY